MIVDDRKRGISAFVVTKKRMHPRLIDRSLKVIIAFKK